MFNGSTRIARVFVATLALAGCLLSSGCGGSYATPGGGADLRALTNIDALTDTSINATLAKKPLATLPCGIAAVRIQAPGYYSELGGVYGTGNYCIITTRDVESEQAMKAIGKLPMVIGVAPVNRLLLPAKLNSDLELRQAAAALHADMLLIYTIDTTSVVEDHLTPATVFTLGLSPNVTAQVVSTASAVLMDTRNGYVYGFAEATEHGLQPTNGWMTEQAVSDARRDTEAKAFAHLVKNLGVTWTGVVANLSEPKAAIALAAPGADSDTAPSKAPIASLPSTTYPSLGDANRTVPVPVGQPEISASPSTPAANVPPSLGRNRDMGMTGNGGHFAAGAAIDPLMGVIAIAMAALAVACKISRTRRV